MYAYMHIGRLPPPGLIFVTDSKEQQIQNENSSRLENFNVEKSFKN